MIALNGESANNAMPGSRMGEGVIEWAERYGSSLLDSGAQAMGGRSCGTWKTGGNVGARGSRSGSGGEEGVLCLFFCCFIQCFQSAFSRK
jgi:hypothetical protein